jgi:hypothetical protein
VISAEDKELASNVIRNMSQQHDAGMKYGFELISSSLDCLQSNREFQEQLLQYNLDKSLEVFRFRLQGQLTGLSQEDYIEVLRDFFTSSGALAALHLNGEPLIPIAIKTKTLGLDITNMDFFDRLTEESEY